MSPFSSILKHVLAKSEMSFNKMIIARGQVELGFQLAEFLRESVSSSRQSSRALPHSQIITFNERSIDIFAVRREFQSFFYLLRIAKDNCCFYRYYPSLFTFLYHLSVQQFWRWNQFWFWWSTFFSGLSRHLLNNTICLKKCSLIVVQFVIGKERNGVPKGIRTPVAAVKGRSPRPLDDGDI